MGIRYYAYAFDSGLTAQAMADPRSIIGPDPFADAWGLERGAMLGVTDGKQSLPARDLLYLDKAWPYLQRLTEPRSFGDPARPAYRMFEGQVTYASGSYAWHPWMRTLQPDEVAVVSQDLQTISDRGIEVQLWDLVASKGARDSDFEYVIHYFHAARDFASLAASEGRGFAYLIG